MPDPITFGNAELAAPRRDRRTGASAGRVRRVLFIAHGHPEQSKGGGEIAAHGLFRGVDSTPGWEGFLLARCHQPFGEGSHCQEAAVGPRELLWYIPDHDPFWLRRHELHRWLPRLQVLLRQLQPDVVHVQHADGFGLCILPAIRSACPTTPILYSLHEFLPICHARGWMLRPHDQSLCRRASALRCNRCFPAIPVDDFLRRELFVKARLGHVDRFLCPSQFLLERYAAWGIAEERLRMIENACAHGNLASTPARAKPNQFGYFGQLSEGKGLLVLLKAAAEARKSVPGFHLFVNGTNLGHESEEFKKTYGQRLRAAADYITDLGSYDAEQLGPRMAKVAWVVVPSVWWENSPLVIQEAFAHGRPVICSDVGGMAEKVRDGVDGLHFRRADAEHLAAVLIKAATQRKLASQLRARLPAVCTVQRAVSAHLREYEDLLQQRTMSGRVVGGAAAHGL